MPTHCPDPADALTVGSTYRFRLEARLNGAVWNLALATVQLLLRDPDGNTETKSATVTDPVGGIAVYDSVAADLDEAGGWRRSWKVTDGSIIQTSQTIPFSVEAAP